MNKVFVGKEATIINGKCAGISGLVVGANSDEHTNDGVMFDEGRIKVIDDKKDEIKTSEKRTGGVVPNFKFR